MTRTRALLLAGLLLALVLAGGASHYASNAPDGLTKVAAEQGFDGAAEGSRLDGSPLAGYQVRGLDRGPLARGLAGVLGVVGTLAVGALLFRLLRGRRRDSDAPTGREPAGREPAPPRP